MSSGHRGSNFALANWAERSLPPPSWLAPSRQLGNGPSVSRLNGSQGNKNGWGYAEGTALSCRSLASIPSPSSGVIDPGPLHIHMYGLRAAALDCGLHPADGVSLDPARRRLGCSPCVLPPDGDTQDEIPVAAEPHPAIPVSRMQAAIESSSISPYMWMCSGPIDDADWRATEWKRVAARAADPARAAVRRYLEPCRLARHLPFKGDARANGRA